MQHFFELVSRKAPLILAIILAITVFFASQLPNLRIETSMMRMLVEDLPAKEQYDRFKEEFGGASDDILVVFKADDVFLPAAVEKIGQLTEALKSVAGVRLVVSLSTLKNDLDILNEWTLEDFRRNLNSAEVFVRNLISADGKVTALVVILEESYQAGPTTEAVEKVLKQFRHSEDSLQVYQIGYPVVGHTLTKYTENDFRILPFFTMLVIFLVLLFSFRTFRGALIPFAAVCVTLVWTFGLMGLLHISLSMVTMIIPTLLIAVGSAYALHIMAAYFDETAQHETTHHAIVKGLVRVCLPTIFASITTIVSFASLLLNRIAVVKEFATFSCLGLFFMLIIHLTFIPAALSCLRISKAKGVFGPEDTSWIGSFLKRVIWTVQHRPKVILLVASIISIIAAAGLFRIRVETTPISFFKDPSQIRMAFQDIHRNLAGIYPINVILRSGQEGYFTSSEVLGNVEAFQERLAAIEGVDLAISIVDLLKFEGFFTRGFRDKDKYYVVPDDPFAVREAIKNYRLFEASELVDHFVSSDFSAINIVCRSHIASTADFIVTEKEILSYLRDHFPDDIESDVTGLSIVGSHSAQALTKGQIRSLGLALVCIFVLLSILFHSYKVGLLAMIPNLFPILVNFGIMGWSGIQLTVATGLVASIAIGLAVDDSIHYMFRFNYQFMRDFSRRQANYRAIADVGKPIVLTSVAIGLGFSVLLFSSFVPTSVFGLLMIVTMASALFGDLFILPVIMQAAPWLLAVMERGIGFYRKIPLFRNLSLSEARRVVLSGSREHRGPGDIIFRQGDSGRGMYLVLQGKVELSLGEAGIDSEPVVIGHGEVFGKLGIGGPSTRTYTATAADNSVLLCINEHAVDYLEKHSPKIAFTLYLNIVAIVDDKAETMRGVHKPLQPPPI
jgi:hydrophobe/amphiphile efflux-3 (HAE3) family protein